MAATPSDIEQIARLALAAGLGGAVGAERELADQPAGLRTHMLLSLGACLFTMISAYAFGAGAILRHGASIRGLTTAASIWATCALGLAVGIGRYALSLGATVLTLATLGVLRVLRNRLQHWSASREQLAFTAVPGFSLEPVVSLIRQEGGHLRGLEHEQGQDGDRVVILVRFPPRYRIERFVESLSQIQGVREVEWEA
jgi:putative Mg2+ transporter-C (MgtC) family protein